MQKNIEIKVETVALFNSVKVTGFVGAAEVISISNHVFGEWGVGASRCLPTNLGEAQAYSECMRQAFARATELGAPQTKS